MANRPLLIFPRPVAVEREGLPRQNIPWKPFRPGWQDAHVGQPLEQLRASLERRTLEFSIDGPGTIAEEVLVLETVGNVTDFINAVRHIAGLEWLVSFDIEEAKDEGEVEDVLKVGSDDNEFAGATNRLFALATNAEALNQLLSLWKRHEQGQSFEHGLGSWKQVFANLREVRRWSVNDRIRETGVVEFWRDALSMGRSTITFAVEFWFRLSAAARQNAFESLRSIAQSLGGSLAHSYEHEPTGFHGAVATLPPAAVRQFLDQPDAAVFLQRTEVMFCRPQGQTAVPLAEGDAFGVTTSPAIPPTGEPVAALLDGLPMENHAAYAGWLRVDDPDGWAAEYEASDRQHGTSMASLIVRGDLNLNETPLASPLYARPILKPDPAAWDRPRAERIPMERFPQDLLEIAVRRFKIGTSSSPASAPSVHVVNLSVGDSSRIFDGAMSPWARMVDYLAWQHNLLFIVSAGNHASVQIEKTLTEWEAATSSEREREALLACWRDVRRRRLLSPAEAINAVTVAAQHTDGSGLPTLGALGVVPIQNTSLASMTSAFGPGYRRAVKPDIALPGGRQVMLVQPGVRLDAAKSAQPPGQLAAVPGAPSSSNAIGHTRGTSNSAALATRQAVAIIESLHTLGTEPGNAIPPEFLPVLAKALLAHAASAADTESRLRDVFDPGHDQRVDLFRRRHVISTVGYGSVEPARAIGADDHRATLIGWGELRKEQAHEFRLPLPPSLNAILGKRRLTFTLAWFSPINPRSRAYRCARLWLSFSEKLATERAEAEWRCVRNGTLQHEIWEGESAAVFSDGADLIIRVNCREDAGKLQELVRYGLAVSIEAAVELQLPIYEEVREAIAVRVQVS